MQCKKQKQGKDQMLIGESYLESYLQWSTKTRKSEGKYNKNVKANRETK